MPGAGVDQRVAMVNTAANGTATDRYYYHVNRLGTVIAMVSETGTVSDHYIYTPFGIEEPLVTSGNPFRYTGRRYDAETTFYYYRARYHSPSIGRFLQTDPVGYADQMNLYAYVGNSPLMGTDPSGKCPWCLVGAAIGVAANLGQQLYENGGFTNDAREFSLDGLGEAFSQVDGGEVAVSGLLGAVGGSGGTLIRAGVTGSIKVFGRQATVQGGARVGVGATGAAEVAGAGATAAMINDNEGPVEGAVEEVIGRVAGIPGAGPMIDQAQNFLEDPSSHIDSTADAVRDTVFREDFSNTMWGDEVEEPES